MTVISVSGFIGSGKDSVADYLISEHGFKKMSFASALKDAVSAIFGWDRILLDGGTAESRAWRDQVDTWWAQRLQIKNLTPRWVLQQWGTEVCRTHFHSDIWVASIENKLRSCTDDVVITDSRFKNELQCIRNVNGTTVRIHRGPEPEWYEDAAAFNRGPNNNSRWAIGKATLDRLNIHASEYSSVGMEYDYNLSNNGSLSSLYHNVEAILSQLPSRRDAKSLLCA